MDLKLQFNSIFFKNCIYLGRDKVISNSFFLPQRKLRVLEVIVNYFHFGQILEFSPHNRMVQAVNISWYSAQRAHFSFDIDIPLKSCWNDCKINITITVSYCWSFLVESLIRVMYWVAVTILNWPFKPVNINSAYFLHISVH